MDDDTRHIIISLPIKFYRHARRLLDFAPSDPDTEELRKSLVEDRNYVAVELKTWNDHVRLSRTVADDLKLACFDAGALLNAYDRIRPNAECQRLRRTLDAVSDTAAPTACEKCGGLLTPGQMLDGWTIHPDCRPDDEKRLGRVMASIARKQGHDHACIRALTDTLEYKAGQMTGPSGLDEVHYRPSDKVDGQLLETALMLVTGAAAAPMDALHRTVELPVNGAQYLRIEEVKIGDIGVTVLEWRGKFAREDIDVGDTVSIGNKILFVTHVTAICSGRHVQILAVTAEDPIPF